MVRWQRELIFFTHTFQEAAAVVSPGEISIVKIYLIPSIFCGKKSRSERDKYFSLAT